jgi:hypothetical protein
LSGLNESDDCSAKHEEHKPNLSGDPQNPHLWHKYISA